MTALLTYVKDGTVIKDADGIDLLEWATRDLLEEDEFPETLGPLRVRAAKASAKDRNQTTRCLESCLLHWDLVSAQQVGIQNSGKNLTVLLIDQIAALIDKSFPQERSFLFWNIAITHLLAVCPTRRSHGSILTLNRYLPSRPPKRRNSTACWLRNKSSGLRRQQNRQVATRSR